MRPGRPADPRNRLVIRCADPRTDSILVLSVPTPIGRLRLALERLHLGGLITNRDYLVAVLDSPEFAAGDTTTDFIERVRPVAHLAAETVHEAAVAGALWLQGLNRANDDIWGFAPSNWRNAGLPAERVTFVDPSTEAPSTIAYTADRNGRFTLDTGEVVELVEWATGRVELVVDVLGPAGPAAGP